MPQRLDGKSHNNLGASAFQQPPVMHLKIPFAIQSAAGLIPIPTWWKTARLVQLSPSWATLAEHKRVTWRNGSQRLPDTPGEFAVWFFSSTEKIRAARVSCDPVDLRFPGGSCGVVRATEVYEARKLNCQSRIIKEISLVVIRWWFVNWSQLL